MKAQKNIALLLLASLTLLGCKKELEPQESSTDVATTTEAASSISPEAAPATEVAQPVQPAVTTQPAQAVTATPAPTAKGMNPPHGQPGHRCDIAVGAPLTSAPAKSAPQTIQPRVEQKPAAPTTNAPAILNAPAQATAPGMNPPHGQAGHRCDIAVGAPLPKAE